MDFYSTEDMYDSFRRYQTALLEQFDHLADEFKFEVIDARHEPAAIFEQLREGILRVLAPAKEAETVKRTTGAERGTVSPAAATGVHVVPRAPATAELAHVATQEADDHLEDRRKKS
jgi:hypothetical protein